MDTGSPYSSLSTPPSRTAMLRAESMNPSPMSPFLSESAHVLSLQYPDMEPSPESRGSDSTPTMPSPNEPDTLLLNEEASSSAETIARIPSQPEKLASGVAKKLYMKTFKGIESRLRSSVNPPSRQMSEEISPASETVLSLNTQCMEKHPTWFRNERGKLRISRKVFGKAPWHRKESGDSISSVSSSIREVLRGGTPPATPSAAKTMQLLSPITASQYPGGEATRIPTPPLDLDTADGRVRGFFTCATPPAMDGSLQPSSPIRSNRSPRSDAHRRSLTNQPKEWWEQMPQRPNRRDSMADYQAFNFDVPEHLPNSPLCPANKNHRGGGKGACVYHGRNKGGLVSGDGAMTMDSDEWLSRRGGYRRW